MYEENCTVEAKVATKTSPIPEAMNHLNDSINELEKMVFNLRDRLDPILESDQSKEPSEEIQLAAIYYDKEMIQYIHNPTERVRLRTVEDDGMLIRYIHNPSELVKLAAASESAAALKYIDNPSEEVQLAAVRRAGYGIKYLNNPSYNVLMAAYKMCRNV
jgi:hypothetical protein